MLDINKIRTNKNGVEKALLKRMKPEDLDLDKILELDEQRRGLIPQIDELKAERNKFSKSKPDKAIIDKMKAVGEKIKKLETELEQIENKFNQAMSALPNLPAEDVVAGGPEFNKVLDTYGNQPKFSFPAKDHVALATSLKMIDYERAVKMSGSGFWAYTGDGALLEWALLNYFIDFHRKNRFTFIIPPYLLNEDSAFVSGHLPKFKDDLYWTQDNTCLNATAEMMLGNYHRDEILPVENLPLKYFAFSTCFRREAGSYRTEERGMVRGHQFNKIEMFSLAKPEESREIFTELLKAAQALMKGLDLHFQTSQLAAGDCSAAMAKTVDLEVWLPSMNTYKEVSSVSNALDYQARRGNIKYKTRDGKKEYVHTLNASGLATSRLIPAILEQNQRADGSIAVPKVLRKFMGKKVIKRPE